MSIEIVEIEANFKNKCATENIKKSKFNLGRNSNIDKPPAGLIKREKQ